MNKITFMLDNLPNLYNKEDESNLYKVLKPIADSLDAFLQDVNRVRESNFIDNANYDDLEKIAKLLNMTRLINESDEAFRGRIRTKVPSFIGGGTLSAIKQVVTSYLGVEPVIIEHYKPNEGHALFDKGVLNGLVITPGTGLVVNFSAGIWYNNGIKYEKVAGVRNNLAPSTTNYITAGIDRIIYARTSSTINANEVLLATVVTNATNVVSITDARNILNPEEHYITNAASITVQIPFSFNTSNISLDDVKDILRNTKAAGIALLIKVMESYNDSIICRDKALTHFLVGYSGIGGNNLLGGV